MDFYEKLHYKYSSILSKLQFSKEINKVEIEIFKKMPWLLELPEAEQNDVIEFIYSLRPYVN